MNYSVVFSSNTGNTAKLAETVRAALPSQSCSYYGKPDVIAANTPLIFAGFWTDKGSCNAELTAFLKQIKQKKVFLFGTAGFGGSSEYFDKILFSAVGGLDSSCEVVGSFMCQGSMPISVRERYEKMLTGEEGDAKINGLLGNFDRAATHPDGDDLERLRLAVLETVNRYSD